MTPLKVSTALLCEFISESVGNKHTLVNVIPGDLIVQDFPARLQMAFYFEVTPKDDETDEYVVEVTLGRKVKARATAQIEFKSGKSGIISLPMGILSAEEPGLIKVTIGREGERPLTLLRRQLLQAKASNDSQ